MKPVGPSRLIAPLVVAVALCSPCNAERTAQVGAAATSQIVPSSRILVMPFENLKREGRIFWLAEASAVLLTDDLNALGTNAITRQERQQAFERLKVPPAAALTDA